MPALAAKIPKDCDWYVVDDGSSDGTGDVARNLGARVVRHAVNLGQGYAMLTGMKTILSSGDGRHDYIVFLDADGQHDPSEMPGLIQKAETGGLDVVVGSRVLGSNYGNAPLARRMFLPAVTGVVNCLTGYRLTDAMCGFRVFRAAALRRILPVLEAMREPQYLAAEMFIRFARAGMKIGEAPVALQDRTYGRSHKGSFRYGYGILRAIAVALTDTTKGR